MDREGLLQAVDMVNKKKKKKTLRKREKDKMIYWLEKDVDSSFGNRENLELGGKPKKTAHLQQLTVFSNHPSSCVSPSTEDFVLFGKRKK